MFASMADARKDIHNSDVPVLCRSCEARHRGLCGVLSTDELVELSRHTRVSRQSAGSELIGDGARVTSYANVMRGVVKLSKVLEDGRQQVVGLQFAPDFLGRLYGQDSALTAEAASDVDLCRVPRPALEALIDANPAVGQKLMQQMLRELDEARDWMVTLGRKTAAEKVASFVYLIATHIDPAAAESSGASAQFELPLSRADIADFLGLTLETVSRQISAFKREGLIEVTNYRQIVVPSLGRLRDRCG